MYTEIVMNLFSAFVKGISICMPKLWVSSFQWRCYLSAHLALFRIPRCGKIHLIRLISKAKEMVRRRPGPYLSTAIFDLNHPPCPLFVICAREENFASFAISPHAGFVIGERANAHNARACYRTGAEKTKVEKSQLDVISDCSWKYFTPPTCKSRILIGSSFQWQGHKYIPLIYCW